ncbi:hypothetical protein JOD24_001699 [Kroppenstedtia sanguinis]|uniref:Protease complex subunit PrcB family protein n=1 Tax=Kroppenstedtia sanguinis TaxID=1380684 RepID=A0ABW4CBB6_9BACL
MGSGGKQAGEFSYRILTNKEQKKLPGDLRNWLEEVKQRRGVHLYQHRGHQYLMISAGMKPNPGHRLELVGVKKERGEPGFLVREVAPEPGKMHPQVISFPYLVIRVKGPVPKILHANSGDIFTQGAVTEADPKAKQITESPKD